MTISQAERIIIDLDVNVTALFMSDHIYARYSLAEIQFPAHWEVEQVVYYQTLYNQRFLERHPDVILIKILDERARQYYEGRRTLHAGDSGIDLHCLTGCSIEAGETVKIKFGIACQTSSSFWLVPRSSISKTCLRMSNSIGLIDQGYRGEIMAVVDHIKSDKPPELISAGDRLFQLARPDLKPMRVVITDFISHTSRGIGGFGSTN